MTVREILAKLVSFKIYGGDPNLELINWVKAYLEDHDVEAHLRYNDEKSKALLFCRIGPNADGGVVLSGHTDVVPVEGQDWDTDPFVLTEKDGLLYGRGSCDMKGFLACCLGLVPEMVKASLKKPIYFGFSYDEEIGCLSGDLTAQAIKEYYNDVDIPFAIIGEPTMMQATIGQKGICVLKTQVNGSAGHSSRILQEVSAIHESVRLVSWLESKMIRLKENGVEDKRFDPPHSSIHIGQINAGIAPNVIADECTFFWDVRNIPADSMDAILSDFDAYCKERELSVSEVYADFKIKTEQYHPPVPPLDNQEEAAVVTLLRRLGVEGETTAVSYAAEAGQFAMEGFDAVICGPGSIAQAHRANEFISIEQLDAGEHMLRNLIEYFS